MASSASVPLEWRNRTMRLRIGRTLSWSLVLLLLIPTLLGGQYTARGAEPDARRLSGHTDVVWSVAFSPDSQTLATASRDGTIRLWDVETGNARRVLDVGRGLAAISVVFAKDGTFLAASAVVLGRDVPPKSYIEFWDTRTWKLTRTFRGGSTPLVLSPDGKLLATPDGDGYNQIKIWDLRSGKPVRVIESQWSFGVRALAFSPDGRLLAGGGYDHAIKIWEVSTGALRRTITRNDSGPIGSVSSLAWSTDGRILASASGTVGDYGHSDLKITLWNPVTGAVRRYLGEGEGQFIEVVALSPDGRLAAGGTSKFVMVGVWELQTGKQIHFFARNEGFITSLAFSPDSTLLASSSYDPVVWLWRMRIRP